jgi:hypothetical protein
VVKINWNTTLDNLNKKLGMGMIARDVEGLVQLASMCTIVHVIYYIPNSS